MGEQDLVVFRGYGSHHETEDVQRAAYDDEVFEVPGVEEGSCYAAPGISCKAIHLQHGAEGELDGTDPADGHGRDAEVGFVVLLKDAKRLSHPIWS